LKVTPGVFAWLIDLDASMAMVLDDGNPVVARFEFSDESDQESGLAHA
jgi:hypothetical protein